MNDRLTERANDEQLNFSPVDEKPSRRMNDAFDRQREQAT